MLFGTYILSEEVEYWWENTSQRMEAVNVEITWANFKNEFLDMYFPTDVRSNKKIKLLELKQGNMFVVVYAAKFEDLSRFCPHYNGVDADGYKCVKIKSSLHPEIKQFIKYPDILHFSVLVNKCRIYDEDSRAKLTH